MFDKSNKAHGREVVLATCASCNAAAVHPTMGHCMKCSAAQGNARLLNIGSAPSILNRDLQTQECLRCMQDSVAGAMHFITNYCITVDEERKLCAIPDWEYVREIVTALWEGKDLHISKTRQMMATWIICCFALWELQFRTGSIAFMASRKEKLVDDGGENSSPNSLFGRVRWLHVHLQPWVKREITFTYLKAECKANNAYLVGESANSDMGRGGTYSHAYCDEWTKVPQSEACFSAVRAACPRGLVLLSTPWGPTGNFYRIWKTKPKGFRFIRLHWTRHPERIKGMTLDLKGLPTSPWYENVKSSMTEDQCARELDISFSKSVSGLVYPQFDPDKHIRSDIEYDPKLPLYLSMDFGIGAATAAMIFQVHGDEYWGLIDYEQDNEIAPVHALRLWKIMTTGDKNAKREVLRVGLGYEGLPSEVLAFGDPAGNAREIATGSTVIREFRGFGFSNFRTKKTKVLDGLRQVRDMLHMNKMFFSDKCEVLSERFGDYRFRSDEDDGKVKEDLPEKGPSCHIMDALRYGVVNVYPKPGEGSINFPEDLTPARHPGLPSVLAEETRLPDVHDRGPLTSGGYQREF